MDSNIVVSIVSAAATISTVIFNQVYSIWDREKKDKEVKLDLEIARLLAQQRTEDALAKTAADLKMSLAIVAGKLQTTLDDNTDISKKAFSEANHVNQKIVAMQELWSAASVAAKEVSHRQFITKLDMLGRMENVDLDTNEQVHRISDRVEDETGQGNPGANVAPKR